MNEQTCLSFTILPDSTDSLNFSVFPINEEGAMVAEEMKSILIAGVSADSDEVAFVDSIKTAISAFRQAKGI
jgi:hypothetical protein